MFDTSTAYRESLDSGYLNTDVYGSITLTNGKRIEFGEKEIVPGSLSYDNKAVNGSDFCFGGIYVGELCVDLMMPIDRYSLADAVITLNYYQTTLKGDVQEIPMGIFYVYEATRTKKIISLKAYDGMTKFDKAIEESTAGTMFDILSFISEKCEMELSQTEEEIVAFRNADWWLNLDPEHISTYREAVSQVGLLSGRFATIDRNGRLVFREFQTKTTQDSISARRRTESTIQDFKTYFCGVKARFLANTNFYPYTAIDETVTKGILLDLGDISLFIGEEESKKSIMENLLESVKGIIYVPADISTISDPSVDLGDTLELRDVNNSDESVVTIVHSLSWKYHGKQKIVSFGSDPKLAGIVSREEKMMSQLENQMASKDLVVKTYTNSRKITIGSEKEQEVFLFNFATIAATTVMFMGTIPFESSEDGQIVLQSYLDGVLDETSTVREYVERGQHSISLTGYYPMKADGRATLKVTMMTEYFESDYRVQNSNIISLLDYAKNQGIEVDASGVPHLTKAYEQKEVDKTTTTVSIKKSAIKGLLFAQGIAGAGQWDGTINVEEYFSPVPLDTMSVFGAIKIGHFLESPVVKGIKVKNTGIVQHLDGAIFAGGENYLGGFMGEVHSTTEEIPHGDGADGFAPIMVGESKIMLGFISESTALDRKE